MPAVAEVAKTYMDVGEAMGRAMVELMGTSDGSSK